MPSVHMKLNAALSVYVRLQRSPSTNRIYKRVLDDLVAAIGPERAVKRVAFEDLADYVEAQSDRLKPSSLHTYVQIIQAFFNWCVDQGYVKSSPAAMLAVRDPGPSPISRAIPADAYSAMLYAAVQPRDRAIMLFLGDTGCRIGGCARLTLPNLNLTDHSAVTLEKGNRWFTGYFGEETAEALRRWLAVRPNGCDRVFTLLTGEPASPTALGEAVRRLAKRAGCAKIYGPHSIRHAVGEAFSERAPVTVTQAKLGHADPQTTFRRYYVKGNDRVRAYSEQLPLSPLRRDESLPPNIIILPLERLANK